MFVRDSMTRQPITVRPDSDPLAALGLLKVGKFRHLPVIDAQGSVVGIVDRRQLETFLDKAGSPGITRRQHRVDQVMSSPVITVSPQCPLEEAASLMVRYHISSLPVVEAGKLVGIITETDIFKLFAAVLGGGARTFRLTVQIPNVPGQLSELTTRIARVKGNVTSLVTYPANQPGRLNLTLRIEGVKSEDLLQAVADFQGMDVIDAWNDEDN